MKIAIHLGVAWAVCALSVIRCQETMSTPSTTTGTLSGMPLDAAAAMPIPTAAPEGPTTPSSGNSSEDEMQVKNSRALFGMNMVYNELQRSMGGLFDFTMDNLGRMAETCGCNRSVLEKFLPPTYGRPDASQQGRRDGVPQTRPDGFSQGRPDGLPQGRPDGVHRGRPDGVPPVRLQNQGQPGDNVGRRGGVQTTTPSSTNPVNLG